MGATDVHPLTAIVHGTARRVQVLAVEIIEARCGSQAIGEIIDCRKRTITSGHALAAGQKSCQQQQKSRERSAHFRGPFEKQFHSRVTALPADIGCRLA